MKKRLTLPLVAALAFAAVAIWVSGVLADTSQPAATVEADATDPIGWTSLEGPYERVAYGLAYDPDTEMLYVGTWGHGLYSSWDGGETWEPVTPGALPFIRRLAVPSSRPGAILAGTYGKGLYYSEDWGMTWKQLGGGANDCLSSPKEADHPLRTPRNIESLLVYAEGDTEWILAGTHNGICAGTVLSDTWSNLNAGFPDTDDAYYIYSLARDPAGRLYAGTRDGLYYSSGREQPWLKIGPPADLESDDTRRIRSLAVFTGTANAEGVLLIGTRGAGMYALKELDTGEWEDRNDGLPDREDARTIQALRATSDGRVYAGTVDNGVLFSTDGGQSWVQVVEGLPNRTRSVTGLAWDPQSGTVYAGTYGDGVYRLMEGAQTWQAANKKLPVDFDVQQIAFAGAEEQTLLAGLRVGGLYIYEREQEMPAWRRLDNALPIGPARDVHGLVVTGPEGKTIVAASSLGIYRGPAANSGWQKLEGAQGLPAGEAEATALVQAPNKPEILFAALRTGDGLYRSENGGASWAPAAGNLDEELRTEICCLAMGPDEETIYLGIAPEEGTGSPLVQASLPYTQQVYLTDDGGASWQPLSPIEGQTLKELAWSRRNWLDVFVTGGPHEMLYARTQEGIYVSYTNGEEWVLRQKGLFQALLADPYRRGTIYAAASDAVLTKEFQSSVNLSPDLWFSYDGGETWAPLRPGPQLSTSDKQASITTLRFDPNHHDQLFVGTEGNGIFWKDRPRPPFRVTLRAGISFLLLLLLVGFFIYAFWKGAVLARRYKLRGRTCFPLGLLQIRRKRQVDLVVGPDTPLTSLEQLILVVAPDERFLAKEVSNALNRREVPVDLAQVQQALEQRLTSDYELLRSADGGYELLSPLLGLLASARFWDDVVQRDRLIREVFAQNSLRNDVRQFFRHIGFEAFSIESGFRITSALPEYALLGADPGIYVHPCNVSTEAIPVDDALRGANRTYETDLSNRIAFLVVPCCPRLEDLQHMMRLRKQEGLRFVLLPHVQMQRPAERTECRHVLESSLQRSLGSRDLFNLSAPIDNPLDFWGRRDGVSSLKSLCEAGGVASLTSMARVGKTSLARQVMHRLPNALIAWVDRNVPPGWDLYAMLYKQWLEQARIRFPDWEASVSPSSDGPCTSAEIHYHLAELKASLTNGTDHEAVPHLAAVVDGLPGMAASWNPLTTLARGIAETEGASLLCIFQRPVQVEGLSQIYLKPLEQKENEEMIHILAAQMGFEFESEAASRLHELSGGHPLTLRELASRTVLENKVTDRPIQVANVEQAAAWYLSQPHSALRDLWESLLEDEQRLVLAILAGRPPQPAGALSLLQDLGWLRAANGGWVLFSPLLARWLETVAPAP